MKVKEWYNNVPSQFKSKYSFVIIFFLVWMTFFDMARFSVLSEKSSQRDELLEKKERLEKQIEDNYIMLENLNDSVYLDHFARDKYMMKRKDEDLFVIIDSTSVDQ